MSKYKIEKIYNPKNDKKLAEWEEVVQDFPLLIEYKSICKTSNGEYYMLSQDGYVDIGITPPIESLSFEEAMTILKAIDINKYYDECYHLIPLLNDFFQFDKGSDDNYE